MAGLSKEQVDKVLEAIEVAKATGKLKKGVNEVTKAVEKGKEKLAGVAANITPKEIVMNLPVLAEEKGVPYVEVPSKEDLGAAAGIDVGTAAVAIIEEGEAKALIKEFTKKEE